MSTIMAFFYAHQVMCTLAAGFIWSSFISALPAPTATSGGAYKFFFAFFNVLAANISRASSTHVESSPNFQDAVNAMPGPKNKPVVIVEANPPAKP